MLRCGCLVRTYNVIILLWALVVVDEIRQSIAIAGPLDTLTCRPVALGGVHSSCHRIDGLGLDRVWDIFTCPVAAPLNGTYRVLPQRLCDASLTRPSLGFSLANIANNTLS